jgi:hypothetical protein
MSPIGNKENGAMSPLLLMSRNNTEIYTFLSKIKRFPGLSSGAWLRE